jgi:16S rRNA processing protein RimM
VEVLTDRPEARFERGRTLHREGSDAPLTIASAAPVADGPGWRLSFREIRSRTAAEPLRDAYLEAVVDRAGALAPGEVFWHEVVGARVLGTGGRELGRVADVYRAGVAEVYVVRGGPAGEFDLPVVHDVVREFAPDRGEIVVDEDALALEEPPVDAGPPRPPRQRRPRWSRHGKGAGAGTGAGDAGPTAGPTARPPVGRAAGPAAGQGPARDVS